MRRLLVLSILLASGPSLAGAPPVLNFTATLMDASGNPVADDSYDVTYGLYAAPSGGTALWEETQTLDTEKGVLSAELGQTTALDPAIFSTNTNLWLQLKVGTQVMTPRLPVDSVPWALFATHAALADDLSCAGCVASSDVATGAITSANIADGTISFSDLAPNACAANQFPSWNGSAWVCAAEVGDISEVQAGAGLSGGATSGIASLSVDFSVFGACGIDNAVTGINSATGAVQCAPLGDITSVNTPPGSGLAGGGVAGDVNLAIATDGVTAAMIAAGAVGSSEIATGAVGSAELATGAVDNAAIAPDAVDSTQIVDGTILFNDWAPGNDPSENCVDGDIPKWDDVGAQWVCGPDLGGGVNPGDITAVNTAVGSGLQGGQSTGNVDLSIATGGVTSAMIADGTVALGDLASCPMNQILKMNGAGTAWTCVPDSTGTVTSVDSGPGLMGGVITSTGSLEVRLNAGGGLSKTLGIGANELGIAPDGVTAAHIAADAVGSSEIAAGAVGTSEIADGSIVTTDIATGAVETTNILDGTIGSIDIATGGVASVDILDGTIVSADIADTLQFVSVQNSAGVEQFSLTDATHPLEFATGSGTSLAFDAVNRRVTYDIATGGVTSTGILDGTIAAADIGTGAVTSTGILDGTIAAADIGTGAVTSTGILDGTIAAADLASDAVTGAKILDGTVASADIADTVQFVSVQNSAGVEQFSLTDATHPLEFAAGSGALSLAFDGVNRRVTYDVATGGITSTQILDGTIAAADIGTGAITSTGILDGTVAAADIGTGAVTSTGILDGTIAAADIGTGAVTSTGILDGTIAAVDLATGSVTTAKILDGTIASADIATGGVASSNILDGTIVGADIGTDTITATNIAAGAVGTSEIADGTVAFGDWASNGCATNQIPKWNGSAWICSDDGDATTNYGLTENHVYDASGAGFTDTGLSADDSCTAAIPLPFTFRFFGTDYTQVFASSNGVLFFGASCSADRLNNAMPTGNFNLPAIAVEWDDWRTDCDVNDRVIYNTFGTSPHRRFVVQWDVYSFADGCGGGRSKFQVTLIEGTNDISVDVVSAGGTSNLQGGAATTGIQASSSVGLGHSLNNAVLTTGQWHKWTQ
jgi:hypothetical protein